MQSAPRFIRRKQAGASSKEIAKFTRFRQGRVSGSRSPHTPR